MNIKIKTYNITYYGNKHLFIVIKQFKHRNFWADVYSEFIMSKSSDHFTY